ncbi:MAG: molybdate ABC transporter permease subunit [Candidatus Solibacter usitatus]|nr:molybdate ABC transporter permease subunit [Candidatus Solibacter usitatus]
MQIDWFPLWLSLRVAALSTLIALLAGLWLAWLLTGREFKGKHLVEACVTLPLVLPPTVLGYYLLVLLGRQSPLGKIYEWVFGQPLVFTWQAAVVAALLHSAPLLIKFSSAALESVPRRYGKAARALGASEWRVFWRVSLPLAWNQILAATALAFARSLGDFGITIMVAGNIPGRTQTISVAIYDAVEGGRGDAARVLVLVISAVALVSLTLASRLGRISVGKAA